MVRPRVHLSEHAEVRAAERVVVTRSMMARIGAGLNTVLRKGVRPGPDLSVPVIIAGGYIAICYPEAAPRKGWVVATILEPWSVTREQIEEIKRSYEVMKKEVAVQ